jgi:hypothetical protein
VNVTLQDSTAAFVPAANVHAPPEEKAPMPDVSVKLTVPVGLPAGVPAVSVIVAVQVLAVATVTGSGTQLTSAVVASTVQVMVTSGAAVVAANCVPIGP